MSEPTRVPARSSVALAAAYHFFLMAAYFILKPLREEMGVVSGARSLKYLWLGTLITSLAVLPPYWKLVAKLPRQRFIPIVNRSICASLVVFWALFRWLPGDHLWVARCFYVWVSVFNLFVLTVFWSFMADSFRLAEGRKLFGFVAAGGTAGALLGAWFTWKNAEQLKATGLLLVSAVALEVATWCALRFARAVHAAETPPATARSNVFAQWTAGFRLLARSPYLLGVALYLYVTTFASAFAYQQRTDLMQRELHAAAGQTVSALRTVVFGWSELATQSLAMLGQLLLSARLLKAIGTGLSLSIQLAIAAAGFVLVAWAMGFGAPVAAAAGDAPAVSGWWQTIGLPLSAPSAGLLAVILFHVALKGSEFGLTKPARESLFTVVSREEKYQSKSLIDTGLYRAFDPIQLWIYALLHEGSDTLAAGFGWSAAACALAAAPVMVAGIVLAIWLGRRQSVLAATNAS